MKQFQCAMCGGTFDADTPEDKALAELHENFGESFTPEDCLQVCDDCYQQVQGEQVTAFTYAD